MFIKVNYECISNATEACSRLNNLPNIFSADFETANKFSKTELDRLATLNYDILNDNIYQQINAIGLSHPELTTITHLSVA